MASYLYTMQFFFCIVYNTTIFYIYLYSAVFVKCYVLHLQTEKLANSALIFIQGHVLCYVL